MESHYWVSVPVELIDYVMKHKLHKEAKLFIALKLLTSGNFHLNDRLLSELKKFSGLKDNRTIHTHIDRLLRIKWITQSTRSGAFFIKSFEQIRSQLTLKSRKAVHCSKRDLADFLGFLAGALINDNIYAQKYAKFKKKHQSKTDALNKRDSAKNSDLWKLPTKYLGVSTTRISEFTYLKYTQANNMKHKAERAGYITTNAKYQLYATLPAADNNFKLYLRELQPDICRRLKSIRNPLTGEIHILLQMVDEIIPHMKFVSRKKVSVVISN